MNDDWLMSEVEISTGSNTSPGAVSDRYIENVGVRLYLAFKNDILDGGFDYYFSEATALILERGDKNTVRFFIPGKEMEMNHYNRPEYYYAEILVNHVPISPKSRALVQGFKARKV